MKTILLIIGAVAILAMGYFGWQVESYKSANDAWKSVAAQQININTQNVGVIVQYLQAQQSVKK